MLMKVLFVDVALTGHHIPYMKALVENKDYESFVVVPEIVTDIECEQILLRNVDYTSRKLMGHLKLLKHIKSIAVNKEIDVIHFLCGDAMYRFFGIGLSKFNKFRTVITFHHSKNGFFHRISSKRIFGKIDIGIVHTKVIKDAFNSLGIKNISHIEYPNFNNNILMDKINARKLLGIPNNIVTMAAIGGTRSTKGLDILLEALKDVKSPFCLLIAGSEEDITTDIINSKIEKYKNSVNLILRYLTNEELMACIAGSDIIVLPYRKIFNGASGPLTEGVWCRKFIIGPNHGSLGDIIKNNNLGLTFEAENIEDLTKVIDQALQTELKWSEDAEKYREYLKPERFIKEYKEVYNNLI